MTSLGMEMRLPVNTVCLLDRQRLEAARASFKLSPKPVYKEPASPTVHHSSACDLRNVMRKPIGNIGRTALKEIESDSELLRNQTGYTPYRHKPNVSLVVWPTFDTNSRKTIDKKWDKTVLTSALTHSVEVQSAHNERRRLSELVWGGKPKPTVRTRRSLGSEQPTHSKNDPIRVSILPVLKSPSKHRSEMTQKEAKSTETFAPVNKKKDQWEAVITPVVKLERIASEELISSDHDTSEVIEYLRSIRRPKVQQSVIKDICEVNDTVSMRDVKMEYSKDTAETLNCTKSSLRRRVSSMAIPARLLKSVF